MLPEYNQAYIDELTIERKQARWQEVSDYFDSKGFYLITYYDEPVDFNTDKLRYICTCGREAETTYSNAHKIDKCWACLCEQRTGSKSPLWNADKTDEERRIQRAYKAYFKWREAVYHRDNNRCVLCDSSDKIHAHHLDGYSWCKARRTDVANGVTLCKYHHDKFHSLYGTRNNTAGQFKKFEKNFKKAS